MQRVDPKAISDAIRQVESKTSGELKIVIRKYCWERLPQAAESEFRKLRLHETRLSNAVMLFVVLANRELLIFGDRGIHACVSPDFWVATKNAILGEIPIRGLTEALCNGIQKIGKELARHFPASNADKNEIGDEIIEDT